MDVNLLQLCENVENDEEGVNSSNNRRKHKKKEKNEYFSAATTATTIMTTCRALQIVWRRVKVKLFAVLAFLRIRNRGVAVEYLSLTNCQLRYA